VPTWRDWRGIDVLADYGDVIVTHKWWTAGDHLIEHGTQGVEVSLPGNIATRGLLRRHVTDRTNHDLLLSKTGTVE
jgi:hypothetical protein